MNQLPREFCEKNRMLVLEESDNEVTLGVSPSSDAISKGKAAHALRQIHEGKEIRFREMSEPELMLAVADIGNDRAETAGRGYGERHRTDISAIAGNAPTITVLNGLLLDAHGRGASDVHIETCGDETAIRFRIDGVMMPIRTLNAEKGLALSARIKLLSNLNTLERRRPQDGRFRIDTGDGLCDMRVSTVPGIYGESVVLRFLQSNAAGDIASLGFQDEAYKLASMIPGLPEGLVLVTGPTGSGKTTTLAALIKGCEPATRKIITIEDPVEFLIPGVTQIQTHDGIGLGFSALLRRILRQDPDVIVVGEIRDPETAELAVRAALTGHLVFSTLHTASATEARTRLLDMGIPAYLLDSTLKAVIGQRLLRKTKRTGTDLCYEGRVPVTEILLGAANSTGGRSLREEAERLVARGITTQDEVNRTFGKKKADAA